VTRLERAVAVSFKRQGLPGYNQHMNEVILETERLLLRMWRESDFEEYARICADAEVMRYLGGKPYSRLEAWRHMAYLVGHWHFRGYGHWAVEEKASGQFIGRLGFLNPAGWPGFEIGWTLGRGSWGKGYATEGASEALNYAFTSMKREHVISLIHPENAASIKVAERLGEKVEGKTEVLGIDVLIYGISRETWRAD
jgi:RimJ/RimL family protein N-acetyltransferase